MSVHTFSEATEAFLKAVDNLGDDSLPLIIALRQTAATLDADGVNASLVNQYRLTYLALAERASAGTEEIDPLEALLSGDD